MDVALTTSNTSGYLTENPWNVGANATDLENQVGGTLLHVLVQVLYGLVCFVGLFGNTLVIYVVLRYSKMQTVTNWYILNLAIADESFLIGIPFLMITVGLGNWPFGNIMCKIYMTTTSMNQFTSSLLLTVMSADRYFAVCHPITSTKFRTPTLAKAVALAAWAASFLMIVPIVMYAHTISHRGTEFCNIYWPESDVMNSQTAFTLYTFTLAFAIPFVLIVSFYVMVLRKLQTVGPVGKSKGKKKSHRKVTKLVLTVIVVYVLCWLPYWVTQIALISSPPYQKQSPVMTFVFLLTGCLCYSNSAVNPLIYAFLSDNFKKSFVKACKCATGRDTHQTDNGAVTRRTNGGFDKTKTNLRSEFHEGVCGDDGSRPAMTDTSVMTGTTVLRFHHQQTGACCKSNCDTENCEMLEEFKAPESNQDIKDSLL